MRLRVERSKSSGISVQYKNGFIIRCPESATNAKLQSALTQWLLARAHDDVDAFVRKYSPILRVSPTAVRVGDFKHLWGSCGKGGIISLNWRLIAAHKPVLEYAVVHELCHLRHRNHSPAFWLLVRQTYPDFERCKQWLGRHQGLLDKV